MRPDQLESWVLSIIDRVRAVRRPRGQDHHDEEPDRGWRPGCAGLRRTAESGSEHDVRDHQREQSGRGDDPRTGARCYTLGSAYAEREDAEKGRLAPGKLADFAILSQDILTVPAERLPATESILTVVGGAGSFTKRSRRAARIRRGCSCRARDLVRSKPDAGARFELRSCLGSESEQQPIQNRTNDPAPRARQY
jgi:hypothetical protein